MVCVHSQRTVESGWVYHSISTSIIRVQISLKITVNKIDEHELPVDDEIEDWVPNFISSYLTIVRPWHAIWITHISVPEDS